MDRWPLPDVLKFAEALVAAGRTSTSRRILQRLDGGELTLDEATDALRRGARGSIGRERPVIESSRERR